MSELSLQFCHLSKEAAASLHDPVFLLAKLAYGVLSSLFRRVFSYAKPAVEISIALGSASYRSQISRGSDSTHETVQRYG